MNYKDASEWVESISIDILNTLPKINKLVDIKMKSKYEEHFMSAINRILKSLKPKDQFDFDFFKEEDDIYSSDKIKETYIKVVLSIDNNDSYSIKVNNHLTSYFKLKERESKLDKI